MEGRKVIDTLDGKRKSLNSLSSGVLEKLTTFKGQAGDGDRIVLVFATEGPLNDDQKQTLDDLKAMGKSRLGALFDVESISLKTIYDRLVDSDTTSSNKLEIQLNGNFVDSGKDLLVGSVPLTNLYDFLVRYKASSGDMDQIYEKNVRRFLGGKGRVNKRMAQTLTNEPEKFGLYNNGITIVTTEYVRDASGALLVSPYIVNGCQTSRTVFDLLDSKLSSGGTGSSSEIENWKTRAGQGVVVTKVVRVGSDGDTLLKDITRNTNSQNAVREKDFIALTEDFDSWKREMSLHYDLYLEIQRGGWDSQSALQKQGKAPKTYSKHANASDLIKIYGAGWLAEVGSAFGKNQPILPQGSIFKKIVNGPDGESLAPFGSEDFYAAYLLSVEAKAIGFGRGAAESRRLSRFLFYFLCVDLIKSCAAHAGLDTDVRSMSKWVVKTFNDDEARKHIIQNALNIVDTYFTAGDKSVYMEKSYIDIHGSNLNTFLKSEDFGRNLATTPNLSSSIMTQKQIMGMPLGGGEPSRSVIVEVLKA